MKINSYLKDAIQFDQIGDTKSALACIYKNITYGRIRDKQFEELNNELLDFDIEKAGITTMLAVLTATAPVKLKLTNRNSLFQKIKNELKKRNRLEKGLLDGLE